MPLWLPPSVPGRFLTSAEGITLTAGATAHTKGAWTQLIASTPADAYFIVVMMSQIGWTGTNSATLVDIGVGPVGSERVIIPDLNAGAADFRARLGKRIGLPLYIPASSRLVARSQSVNASANSLIDVFLLGDPPGPMPVGSEVVALGVNAASSTGTNVAANNVWTEIAASTSAAFLYWDVLMGQAGDIVLPGAISSVEIGFGPAGSETVFVRKLWSTTDQEAIGGNVPEQAVFRSLPAGTRIVVRQNQEAIRDAIVYAVR